MPKTIFNTTEKSNFILNMKTEEYHSFNMKVLLGFLILVPAFCIPLEFFKVYSVPGMGFAIAGVFAMVFAFIGFMKGVVPKKMLLPAGLLGGWVGFAMISMIRSFRYSVAVAGADGRSEGWFSVLFYASVFLISSQLGGEANHKKLFRWMLWMGLFQCGWALFQSLPIGFPNYYSLIEPILILRAFLPSGVMGSPIFLAMLLVLLLFPAMLGAALEENKRDRIFYLVCASVFALFAIRTQCLAGLSGTIAAIVTAGVTAFCKKGKKTAAIAVLTVCIAAGLGFLWSCMAPSINGTVSRSTGTEVQVPNSYALYDTGIMWDDSAYRLEGSGYYIREGDKNPNGDFIISSLISTYGYQWKNTLKIIRSYPLDGAGPDCLAYPQLYQSYIISENPNVFDRCYNYYLHIAATLGIPAALCMIAVFVLAAVRGAAAAKREKNWLYAGFTGGMILFLLLLVFCTSSITVMPVFWMVAGILAGMAAEKTSGQ